MKKSQLKKLIREEIVNVFLENQDLEEGTLKNIALATLIGILPAGAIKGQTVDKEKISTVQQKDKEDLSYPWTPKEEQRKRQQRAIDLYKPLEDKIENAKNSSSIAQQNKKWVQDLRGGTLISSPTDDDFPEFHFRNPPALESSPVLKEIQSVIINLPEEKLQKLLDIDFRKANPKTAYYISQITGVSLTNILKYVKTIRDLDKKGFTL